MISTMIFPRNVVVGNKLSNFVMRRVFGLAYHVGSQTGKRRVVKSSIP